MSSHHDYIIEITAQHEALKPFAPENGQPLRFKIGDAVIYTNEYGAQFRCRVTGFYQPTGLSGLYARGARYYWTRHRRGCRCRNPACVLTTRRDAFALLTGRCALRLPPGESPAGYPRRAGLAPLNTADPAAPDRPDRIRSRSTTPCVCAS